MMHLQPFKSDMMGDCPECGGKGIAVYERWVDCRPNGGFLADYEAECENCYGSGQTIDLSEEDFDDE